MDGARSPSSSTATAVGASVRTYPRHDGADEGLVLRARSRLRERTWKIAALGVLVGPFAALTQAGPDAAGVTDLHRALASMLAVAALVLASEAASTLYYLHDRRRPRRRS